MGKIYVDDPYLPYKSTKLSAAQTRMEIDGLFGKWGIRDTLWHWDPEKLEVYVRFQIEETIGGLLTKTAVRVDCIPVYYHQPKSGVEVSWAISMRVMFWYIKSHLEAAYLYKISQVAAFLPDLMHEDGKRTVKDFVPQFLNKLSEISALPEAINR